MPPGHAQSAYIEGRTGSGRKDYLPTNLKTKLTVKAKTTQMLGTSSGSASPQNPAIFEAFYANMEKMKGVRSPTSQTGGRGDPQRKSRSFLSDKDALIVPKDPNSTSRWNKKVEQRIISSLMGPDEEPLPPYHPPYQVSPNIAKPAVPRKPLPTRESGESFHKMVVTESLLDSYMPLGQYPLYEAPKNLLYLKASSLFNDTILFENEALSIFCRTDKRLLADSNQVVLVLTYRPKAAGINLITFLENEGTVRVVPDNLLIQNFSQPTEQSVFFAPEDKRLVNGFPVMNVTVGPRGAEDNLRVVLPFTVNKYLRSEPFSLDQVMRYLESVG